MSWLAYLNGSRERAASLTGPCAAMLSYSTSPRTTCRARGPLRLGSHKSTVSRVNGSASLGGILRHLLDRASNFVASAFSIGDGAGGGSPARSRAHRPSRGGAGTAALASAERCQDSNPVPKPDLIENGIVEENQTLVFHGNLARSRPIPHQSVMPAKMSPAPTKAEMPMK